jgi:hypothetical protein
VVDLLRITLLVFVLSFVIAPVAAAEPTNASSPASALLSTGDSQFQRRQYGEALQSYQKALALFQQSGDRDG